MNKRIFGIILALAATAAVIMACGKGNKKTSGTVERAVTVTQGPIEQTIEATGEVAPLNRVEVKPPIQGRIENILVDEGSSIKQGQILAWMSSSDRAAILDAARAKGPAELKKWEDDYQPTPIVAPLSGVVILKDAVVGQTVDVGTALFALSDRLIIIANVDEVDIGRVRVGMKARITLDAYPDEKINGSVFSILHEGTNVSNVITYGVKVAPDTVPPFFRSQMTANVTMVATLKATALLVPTAAVRTAAGGEKQVLMPGPDGKPVPRVVTTGVESGDNTEITDGLSPGDTVIITTKSYTPQKQDAAGSSPFMPGQRPRSSSSGSGPARTTTRAH